MSSKPPTLPTGARFVAGVSGFVFAGIGLTLIIFLWSARGFGEPPLFFKIFGSLMALPFIAIGGSTLLSVIRGKGLGDFPGGTSGNRLSPPPEDGYTCSGCGATLDKDAEVSPLGDVKCTYCGNWFNIHGRSS